MDEWVSREILRAGRDISSTSSFLWEIILFWHQSVTFVVWLKDSLSVKIHLLICSVNIMTFASRASYRSLG
jgi:hypothetical protein